MVLFSCSTVFAVREQRTVDNAKYHVCQQKALINAKKPRFIGCLEDSIL